MDPLTDAFLIAAVQATPIFHDLAASLAKACDLIAEAGRAGAKLAVFPEGFLPSYPLWAWVVPTFRYDEMRELYSELLENAVAVPGPTTDTLCKAAAAAGVNVVIGINELNTEASGTTLYNSLLFISEGGRLLGKHRKLIPSAAERVVHAQGDGSTLQVFDTSVGRLTGLICWENYMPLARYALYSWGTQILAAPTWDRGEPWTSTLRHIAKEGRIYVVGCCSPTRRSDIPDRYNFKHAHLPAEMDWINVGGSAIIDPDGAFLVEPVNQREEILYAEVQPRKLRGPRFQLDVAGHYARPDLFHLTVDRRPHSVVHTLEVEPAAEVEETEKGTETGTRS
jgi:nitrilase